MRLDTDSSWLMKMAVINFISMKSVNKLLSIRKGFEKSKIRALRNQASLIKQALVASAFLCSKTWRMFQIFCMLSGVRGVEVRRWCIFEFRDRTILKLSKHSEY